MATFYHFLACFHASNALPQRIAVAPQGSDYMEEESFIHLGNISDDPQSLMHLFPPPIPEEEFRQVTPYVNYTESTFSHIHIASNIISFKSI